MNGLDYLVLIGTMIGIAAYGVWRTRGKGNVDTYVHADPRTRWIVIGISVMATQASAVTFISTPGKGFEDGLGFIQNYFGAPFALIIVSLFFLPMFRHLNVDTAYEFLGKRFDMKTRLLGAGLFLFQRGIGAGITIYAPAIVLSTVMGWRLDLTIVCTGLVVMIYTVSGGSEAVNVTQKYQFSVILAGMLTALFVLISKLPAGLTVGDALHVAGGFHKLEAVDFSADVHKRYTFWSGIFGGIFLQLSYFGTDQSQVQRYLSGHSLRESRLGLMFNAVFKIPMQFFILLLGVLIFVFYQFERPPVFFNQTAWDSESRAAGGDKLPAIEREFAAAHEAKEKKILQWLEARRTGDKTLESAAFAEVEAAQARSEASRIAARDLMHASHPGIASDSDYVFITFILNELPHGLIGLLIAVFFAAAFSSKSAELNALASTSMVDFYRHVIRPGATDAQYVFASKCFTVFWGFVAMAFALFAGMQESLVEAGNIIGSLFYGVPLAIFLVALFLRRVGGSAIFWAAIATQALVIVWYRTQNIAYLWYNLIGCAVCVALSLLLQMAFFSNNESPRRPNA